MWITILSKKPNTKRIEVNVKELEINTEDVSVYRSLKLTQLDFDDDPIWDSNENKNSPRRARRDINNTDKSTEETNLFSENKQNIYLTNDITNQPEKHSTNRYHHPVLTSDEGFIPIKVTDVEHDEANERLFIYLGTEMKVDVYYIVKIVFSGNMTHDRGLYFTTYEDDSNELR